MPDWKPEIRRRLARLHLSPTREAAIVEELAQHLDESYAELLASGVSEAEAYRQLRAELHDGGLLTHGLQRVERSTNPEPIVLGTNRRTNMIADLWQDLRFGARMLAKQPGFTLIAVLTLALGIGANTAIFSVVNAVLLHALPWRDAERLVMVWEKNARTEQNVTSPANFFAWQQQQSVFAEAAAFTDTRTNLGDGTPEVVPGQVATDKLFSVLGANALLGRTFTPEDSQPGQNRVVVISHGLWQRRFGSDPNVVGRKVILNALDYTVIGVMPPAFQWHVRQNSLTGQAAELWTPWAVDPQFKQSRGRYICAVARLKPGVTVQQARAEMDALAGRLTEQAPQYNRGLGLNLVPLREQFAGELRLALLVLMGAVGFVLLIACANVANLLLARAATRQKEIAVRLAMGAGRARIVRQLLTESFLLATLGGLIGLLLAWQGTAALLKLSPPELGDFQNVGIGVAVLGFTFFVALVTGILFGLAPAFEASNLNLSHTLKEAGRSLAGNARSRRLRSALVVAEIALSLVLLVGAGLLLRSFMQLQGVEKGFNAQNVLTMRVALPGSRYNDDAKRINFFAQARERLQALPGVEAAGAINFTPFLGLGTRTGFNIEGRVAPQPDQPLGTTDVCLTDQGFFRTLQIPLRRGRLFTEQEVREQRNVVVINETLAHKYFPNEDPLGKRLLIPLRPPLVPTEIIGVVADVRHTQLDQPVEPMSYWPIAQEPSNSMTFVLRTRGEATAIAAAVRNVIQTLDPQQPVSEVRTLDNLVGNALARQRFNALLLAVFAVVALLLAASGIYGVMAYSLTQRLPELGIRAALGATATDILRLVLGQSLRQALLGVTVGLAAALALTRLMRNLLFNVSATDPWTFAGVALLLIAVALLACYFPARRAMKIDPLIALRSE